MTKEKVRDFYNIENNFNNWFSKVKEKGIEGLSPMNSLRVLDFIKDMKLGVNISAGSKKGERSKARLVRLKQKIIFVVKKLEERGLKDVTEAKDKDLHQLFNDMRSGVIKNRFGTAYRSTGDYVKDFKAFWHWYQRVKKKEGENIDDITIDLDRRGEKPKFVYFTEKDFNEILKKASLDLKPILALAFDSGMRCKELMNIKVGDFSKDFKQINIRDEISKTFGRNIKLMLCCDQIREYVKKLNLKDKDFLSQKSPQMINKELRKLGKKVLKPSQTKDKELTLYDFRHSSACFWLPRYKSESALKYRFGWKKSDMIHYYTEFLGMKDTITQDDLYLDITKAELEKEVDKLKKEFSEFKNQFAKDFTKTLMKKFGVKIKLPEKPIIEAMN